VKERDFRRRTLLGRYIAKMLYKWDNKKFEDEYIRVVNNKLHFYFLFFIFYFLFFIFISFSILFLSLFIRIRVEHDIIVTCHMDQLS